MTIARRRLLSFGLAFGVTAAHWRLAGRALAWQDVARAAFPDKLRATFVTGAQRNFEVAGMRFVGLAILSASIYVFCL